MIQDNSKNIFWINAVRALCILAVYFVHCQIYYGCWLKNVNVFIHPVYVNAFFFVGGYLLLRKQLSEPVIGQSRTEYVDGGGKILLCNIVCKLAIPTILFSVIEYLPKKILRGETIEVHSFLSNTIGGGTYWFTSALVVAEIVILLFILLTRSKNIWTYFIYGLFVAVLGWYLIHIDFHLFDFGRDLWAYRRGLLAVSFMMAGGVYWRYEEKISKLMTGYVLVGLLLIYVIIFSVFSKEVTVLISTMDISLLGYLASLLGCIVLVELCKRMPAVSFLTFIGQFSIGFYFLSGALPMIVSMIVRRFLPADNFGVLILVFAICIMVASCVTYGLNRYFPFVFDLRKIKSRL